MYGIVHEDPQAQSPAAIESNVGGNQINRGKLPAGPGPAQGLGGGISEAAWKVISDECKAISMHAVAGA
jgi:hypothetical protein